MLGSEISRVLDLVLKKAENQHELLLGDCQSPIHLTNTQEHILMVLAQKPLTNSSLAKELGLSQAAMTKATKLLSKEGLLETKRDEQDGRLVYFQLTKAGRAVADEHAQHHERTSQALQKMVQGFSKDEQTVIAKFLKELAKEME
ncbi:zinc-dependent MarR family transcriptional regulator [Streptococcus sp. 10F2]